VSLRINTNIPAMGAMRILGTTSNNLASSINRLSTGMRINNAADDPAGLIISEGLRAQIRGTERAVRNSQDAINMSKTAEAAMEEVSRLLLDIRGLAVHSANTAVVDSAQLQANQTQIRSVLDSINRIGDQTQWGQKKLLDGTAGVVANITSPNNVTSMFFGSTFNGVAVQNGAVTITRTTQATRASVTLANAFASSGAVVATAGSFVINGYSFSSSGTETVQSLVNKINNATDQTGVSASIVPNGPNVSIRLDASQYGSQYNIQLFDQQNILHNAASASASGVDAVFSVAVNTTAGVTTANFTGGVGPKTNGLLLRDNLGNSLQISESMNNSAAATQVGQIAAGDVRFQIGAYANQSASFSMPTIRTQQMGTSAVPGQSLASMDVTTAAGAQNAIRIIDAAISELASRRGDLGSFQSNFLESTVRSLQVAKENMTASESTIRDVDMAEEITAYTRYQILQQSGMSVLAQANQAPQNVLSLLRG